jgi:hypothetical protein
MMSGPLAYETKSIEHRKWRRRRLGRTSKENFKLHGIKVNIDDLTSARVTVSGGELSAGQCPAHRTPLWQKFVLL